VSRRCGRAVNRRSAAAGSMPAAWQASWARGTRTCPRRNRPPRPHVDGETAVGRPPARGVRRHRVRPPRLMPIQAQRRRGSRPNARSSARSARLDGSADWFTGTHRCRCGRVHVGADEASNQPCVPSRSRSRRCWLRGGCESDDRGPVRRYVILRSAVGAAATTHRPILGGPWTSDT